MPECMSKMRGKILIFDQSNFHFSRGRRLKTGLRLDLKMSTTSPSLERAQYIMEPWAGKNFLRQIPRIFMFSIFLPAAIRVLNMFIAFNFIKTAFCTIKFLILR